MIILDDTYTFSDFGLVQEEGHDHPPMPNFSNNTVHIPKRAGRWDFGIDIQEKPFNIPLATESWDRVKLQQRLNEFVAFLFDQYGQPREFKLTFNYEPEKYYMVKLREGFNPERVRPYAKFILPLVANDPYKYAPATYYDPNFVPFYDEGYEYGEGYEYVNQTGTVFNNINQYAGVYNYSHYITPFGFVIEGYVENPKITNQTSGKSLQILTTVEADERLCVDSKLKTTWKEKLVNSEWIKVNEYNNKRGNFIYLLSGHNSLLFEGVNPDANIEFNWLHRFL